MSDDEIKILTADGEAISSEADKTSTRRNEERKEEDKNYLPVIIKRTDESFRHPDDILEKAISEGEEQMNRSAMSLLLSSSAAGLIISFTVMAVAVFTTMLQDTEPMTQRVLTALVYPLGFVLCILSRTQLFTEHTATAVYPILDKRFPVRRLFSLWCIIICGNLLGGLASSQLLVQADDVIHAYEGYIKIADHLLAYDSGSLFISAVLAGWLMALAAWITLSTPSTLSQIVIIYIVTFIIGIGGLHHSIAGSVEMFVGYFISNNYSLADVGFFVSHALAGNLVGGSIFVALLNYGHIRQTQKSD
jgi:formate/nitrite transporter FocA (FNT family)